MRASLSGLVFFFRSSNKDLSETKTLYEFYLQNQNFISISRSNRALMAKTNYCSFVRSVLRNGETDGQAVRTGEFGGTSAAMQRNGVFDNRQT